MFTKNKFSDVEVIRKRGDIDLLEYNYDMNIYDIKIAQGYGQICSHLDIINRYKVSLFVELGVFHGGTLPWVIPHLMLGETFQYIGFENNNREINERIKQFASTHPRCHLIVDDMWKPGYLDFVRNSIQESSGVTYIFCDGGNKPRELSTYSEMLRVGDIISVHDWTENQEGEIRDIDLNSLSDDFAPLDEQWRKYILWLPTFIRVK